MSEIVGRNADIYLGQSDVNQVNKALDIIKVFPVFVTCIHCSAGNVITNPSCVQCGAPMGEAVEKKIEAHRRNKPRTTIDYSDYSQISSGSAYIPLNFADQSASYLANQFSPFTGFSTVVENPTVVPAYNDPTPIYRKCENCWTFNNIRQVKYCVCGVPTSVEEID